MPKIYEMNISAFFKTILVTLTFLLAEPQLLVAQNEGVDVRAKCIKLIEKGKEEIRQQNYTVALESLTNAEILAEKQNLKEEFYNIKINIGLIYAALSNYGEALGYYQEALNLAKESGEEDKLSKILTNIGLLYYGEKNYTTALEYFKKAYDTANTKEANYTRPRIAVNISDVYNMLGQYKEAQKYLLEVKDIPASKETTQMWKINYAESLFIEGNVAQVQKQVEELLKDVENSCYVCVAELLSKIYSSQNKKDLAISYLKKGLQSTSEMNNKIDLFNQLSELYFEKREYVLSKHYKDSVIVAKDSMSSLINKGLFEANKVKLKVQEYQNQLQTNQQKQDKQQFLFIAVIVFSLLLFLFIYRGLKNKIVKQRQEKIIAENREKIFTLELESLKNNIAEKNRSLSAKALYLSGRNELIEEVINSLAKIPEVSQKKEVSDYLKTLKGYLKTDEEWDDFISYFEQVNPEFLRTLTTKHPELTPADIRFLCYIFMNLETKEIGNIFNITYNAAKKRKTRIKEKMGISNEDSLYDYLLQIV